MISPDLLPGEEVAPVSAQSCDSPQASLSLNGGLGAPVLESGNANPPPPPGKDKKTRNQKPEREKEKAQRPGFKGESEGPGCRAAEPWLGVGGGGGRGLDSA